MAGSTVKQYNQQSQQSALTPFVTNTSFMKRDGWRAVFKIQPSYLIGIHYRLCNPDFKDDFRGSDKLSNIKKILISTETIFHSKHLINFFKDYFLTQIATMDNPVDQEINFCSLFIWFQSFWNIFMQNEVQERHNIHYKCCYSLDLNPLVDILRNLCSIGLICQLLKFGL